MDLVEIQEFQVQNDKEMRELSNKIEADNEAKRQAKAKADFDNAYNQRKLEEEAQKPKTDSLG